MLVSFLKLTSLLSLLTFIFAAACQQQHSPLPEETSRRASSGTSDEAALAEALVTLLYVAGKQTQDRGKCERTLVRTTGEPTALQRLLSARLSDRDANRDASKEKIELKSTARSLKG
jgi:hypothetical protein